MASRYYSSVAALTTLSNGVSAGGTSFIVGSTSGFPVQTPFTLLIDEGTTSEEIVTVTAVAGLTLTVTRGEDGTVAVAHDPGARVRHALTARDLRESREHEAATTNVHGIASTANLVTTTGAQTLTNKTLTSPTLSTPSVTGTVPGTTTFANAVTGNLNGRPVPRILTGTLTRSVASGSSEEVFNGIDLSAAGFTAAPRITANVSNSNGQFRGWAIQTFSRSANGFNLVIRGQATTAAVTLDIDWIAVQA